MCLPCPDTGFDVIVDFEVGVDKIGLTGGLTYQDLDFSLPTVIQGQGNLLAVVAGVDAGLLPETDFFTLI